MSLDDAFQTPQAKRRYVRDLFATIADRYDLITRVLSYGQDARWKAKLTAMARAKAGEHALDLACGTGDLAIAVAGSGARTIGLDITYRMVQLARLRAAAAPPLQPAVKFLAGDMTTGELHDRMMVVGADLMGRALAALERGSLTFTPQSEAGVTYASKIDKAESRIDWSKPAAEVHNLIRGMSPFPGAWFELELGGQPTRVKAIRSTLGTGSGAPGTLLPDLTIACGEGGVRLVTVQREGKPAMDAATFLRGAGSLPAVAT